jgi:hypothetical protein
MFLRTSQKSVSRRKAAILLVVLTMLALFAVIGLSFVLYAESEANAARIAKEGVQAEAKLPDSSEAVNSFMGQMIYSQDVAGSALIGHDFARHVFGSAGNTITYNGVGVYREPLDLPGFSLGTLTAPLATTLTLNPLDRTQVVRFGKYVYNPLTPNEYVNIDPDRVYGDGYVERNTGTFAKPTTTPTNPHFVPRNSPYTYPDRKNIYLAVMDPATGQIVKPSYHQPELFTTTYASGSTDHLGWGNPNWYNPQGYFKTLRTRPVEHLTNAEIQFLQANSFWPIPANLTQAQANTLANIFNGNNAAATALGLFTKSFPFPPMNPDGSITGDVQNIKYADGRQRFDSVWIDPNLPIKKFKGRNLKPMIAATILPMDGRVNYNVAGNKAGGTMAPLTSSSHMGFSAAEVNLGKVLATSSNDQTMLAQRYDPTPARPSTRGSTNTSQFFHPDINNPSSADNVTYPPTYSPVDLDGNGATQPANPTNFSTSYSFPSATFGNSSSAEATRPSVMFNPYQWNPLAISGSATAGAGSQFPLSDARWLNARYSEKSSYTFAQTNVGRQFSAEFTPSYPTAPANQTRALLTPASNRLARPGLSPSFFGNLYTNMGGVNESVALNYNPGGNLVMALQSAPTVPQNWNFDLYRNYTGTNPSSAIANPTGANDAKLTGGDAETATFSTTATLNAANFRAILQGVDLNRPLPDYRDAVNAPTIRPKILMGPNAGQPDFTKVWPTDPTTMTVASVKEATEARQALAKDIFQRLCVACGARVVFSQAFGDIYLPQPTGMGTYTLVDTPTPPPMGVTQHTWTVSQTEYDAIRFLAQYAVNIVDAIDADDISTPFIWNPDPAAMPVNPFAAAAINDRVVYGFEKPKLLINEGYAEIANHQDDYGANRARRQFQVRFFLELLNPSMLQSTANPTLDVENPPATLTSDVRNHSTGNLGATQLQYPAIGMTPAYSVYRIQVFNDSTAAVRNELTNRATNNVLGRVTSVTPKLECDFLNMTATAGNISTLGPNNGAFSSTVANPMTMTTTARNGFCVVGPHLEAATTETTPTAFAPETDDASKVDSFLLRKPEQAMMMVPTEDNLFYQVPPVKGNDITPTYTNLPVVNQAHTVVLQRLANPYLPKMDNEAMVTPLNPYNPYITVDFMTDIKIHDAIRVGSDNGMGMGTRTAHPVPAANTRSSSVRRQPFVGNDNLGTKAVADTNPMPPSYYATRQQLMTFFRQNSATSDETTAKGGADPILNSLPFKEPNHFDRRLVNPLEILHVNRGPSHDATWFFASQAPTVPMMPPPPVLYYQNEMTPYFTTGPSPLMRALEVLNTKPWTRSLAVGARVPGGININAIYDEDGTGTSKVFAALLDKQPANLFTAADVTTLWKNIKETKYPSAMAPVPAIPTVFGPTVDEIDVNSATQSAGTDRPFKGFGLGLFSVAPAGPTGLKGGVPTATGHDDTLLRQTKAATGALALATNQGNPYYALEPLRKAFNNLTTTSDTYMVVFTVGFFDIDEPTYNGGTGRVVMRREAYDFVPGDLRSQYTAIIDRSNLGVGVDNGNVPQSGVTGTPWFTELVQAPQKVPEGPSNPASMAFPTGRNRWYVKVHATASDYANSTLFVDYDGRRVPIRNGTRIRIGTGPNAEVVTVVGVGVRYSPAAMLTDIPAFDNDAANNTPAQNTGYGYGTITFDLAEATMTDPAQVPRIHIPGEAVTGDIIPGSPGAVFGFDPTNPNFSGVVRYFGRLKP